MEDEAEQAGGVATAMKYLKNPNEGAIRRVSGALKPQPKVSLWMRPASQKTAGALMVGQNPINENESKTKRSDSPRSKRAHCTAKSLVRD